MENKLAIKVFDIDYSFILKNYLDKELWHKTWILFQYKEMTVTLSLWRIDVYDNSITFKIGINNLKGKDTSNTEYFYVDKCDIKFLKKKIESCIIQSMEWVEGQLINDNLPDIFDNLKELENKIITETVKEYFDDKGISSDTIVDSVTDNCIDEFSLSKEYKDNYGSGMKHKVIYEYYDAFCKACERELTENYVSSNEYLNKARKRFSLIKETSILKDEIINFLNGDNYDINLRMED